jgi:DNA-binding MarR family transcriptional regulator
LESFMTSESGKHSPQSEQPAFDEGMLRDHVGFRVHIARRAVRRVLRDQSKRPAGEALPSGSVSLLELICRNPGIGPNALAEILFLDPPKVTVLLRHLTTAGLVDRVASTADGRKFELNLTPAGRERLEAARQFGEAQERRIAQGLSAGERAELNRLLRKLQETLR